MGNTSIILCCHQATSHHDQVVAFLRQQGWGAAVGELNNPDIHFVNEEGTTLPVERVRETIGQTSLRPFHGERSIFVIYHLETASTPAQNALLKILEEPPEYVQFILTTNQADQILATIHSRCRSVTLTTDAPETRKISEEAQTLFAQLPTASFADIFAVSEQYKERPDALTLIEDLLQLVHQENQQRPTFQRVKQLQKLLETHQLLKQNGNVRLALEECFFAFREKQ